MATLALLSSTWQRAMASRFDFYTPFLPEYIASNETISHIELRLYLPANATDQVRITPMSSSVAFEPASVVFYPSGSVAQTITMVASEEGRVTIEYLAQVEIALNETDVVVVENATSVGAQDIDVLPPPIGYAVEDPNWHGVILLNDSFDSGAFSVEASPLWGRIRHGYPSDACGAASGDRALYFTALGDRFAITKELNLLGFNGKMHFDQLYGHRTGQNYNDDGDNRISCEKVDAGEEVVFSYLPLGEDAANASAWRPIDELPLPSTAIDAFRTFSVPLPMLAMHSGARFRWQQKSHSSFPVDVATGLTHDALLDGENDDTSVNGDLGVAERELWHYRNLVDQWALDDVRLEVRLNPPIVQVTNSVLVATTASSGNVSVSIGSAEVLIDSPVHDTWVEFNFGDGTQSYPSCDRANVDQANVASTTRLVESGYIHAVSCLDVHRDGSSIVSSFPMRSPRILVQARAPTLSASVDATSIVDTWTVELGCDGCAFMRYTTYSALTAASMSSLSASQKARIAPSCSYGTLVDASTGMVSVSANLRIFAIACGNNLLPSIVTESDALVVAPRSPSFNFQYTETTITNEFNVTIHPPSSELGIVYSVGSVGSPIPSCEASTDADLVAGEVTVAVRASDVIHAVACCIDVICTDSAVAVWGPIKVQAVAPIYSMECSHMKPLTMMVQVTSVTLNAWIQYRIGSPPVPLDCKNGVLYTGHIEVAINSTSVFAVSCLNGLEPSDQIEIPVSLEACCAGLDAFRFPSCAHVLLLHDDFASCLDSTKWRAVTGQWGGEDVNGGVHAENVHCVFDDARDKNVLQLSAHGDLYAGTTPVGHKRIISDGSLVERNLGDRFVEWALEGVSPVPCNHLERCPSRRVGAAVATALEMNAGVMVIRLKPCEAFGTLTQMWWGEYASREEETMQQVPFLPLWKAGMYQARSTSEVSFVFSSPSLLSASDTQADSGYVELGMQWNATAGRANLYVNGRLMHKQLATAASTTSEDQSLFLGIWVPNAVAGEPLFSTCEVLVDEVHVFKPEITGDRWCDFESVDTNAIACVSDQDCEDWVYQRCFMPIHEATCVKHHAEPLKLDLAGDDEDDATESSDNAELPMQHYCQFRLEPHASASYATTESTRRRRRALWGIEE